MTAEFPRDPRNAALAEHSYRTFAEVSNGDEPS
jgi:hypothetical protein